MNPASSRPPLRAEVLHPSAEKTPVLDGGGTVNSSTQSKLIRSSAFGGPGAHRRDGLQLRPGSQLQSQWRVEDCFQAGKRWKFRFLEKGRQAQRSFALTMLKRMWTHTSKLLEFEKRTSLHSSHD